MYRSIGSVALTWITLAMLALAAPSQVHASEEVAELVDRVLQVYGGEAALIAARTFRQSGETVSFLRGGVTGRISRTFQPPDRLRIEIDYPGEPPEVRILDGVKGWQQGRGAQPPLMDAMRLQAARLALPLSLLEAGDRVKDLGSAPLEDGGTLRTLGLALADHLVLFVEIELPSYRIVRSRGQMRRAGAAMEFGAGYSDFRRWKGVLVPWREDHYAMGRHIGYTVLERLEVVTEPNTETFRP